MAHSLGSPQGQENGVQESNNKSFYEKKRKSPETKEPKRRLLTTPELPEGLRDSSHKDFK